MSYYTDHRNQPQPDTVLYDGDDEIELPTKWSVCPVCKGKGSHVNPSIDCDGIPAEQFHDDPDFERDYFDGVYDVTCYRCNGRTTVKVVDWDRLTPEQARAYEFQLRQEAEHWAECEAERRMGA